MQKIAKPLFFATLFVVIFYHVSVGQKMAFTTLSVENGLSQGSALAITQDATGFIWIGTRDGLNKYDTRTFTAYKHQPDNEKSLSNSYILSLLGDSNGDLWAGTLHGLNKYDPVHNNFEHIPNLSNDTISVIYEDSKHHLWIGTENGLNLLIDRKYNQFRHIFGNHSAQTVKGFKIHSIFEDHTGTLWIGTSEGLLQVNTANDSYKYVLYQHEINKPKTLSADFITSIQEDLQHRLWIGTQYNGLQLFNPKDSSFIHYLHNDEDPNSLINNNIRKLILDKNGLLWIGTQDGLSVMNTSDRSFTSYQHDPEDKSSISQNSIHNIFKDASGTMWVGTYFGGANVVYSNVFTLYQNNRSPKSISNNVISSIVEDRHKNLWIGTEGGGLNYFNRRLNTFTSYKNIPTDTFSLPSNLVKLVYVDKSNNVWVGVHGGNLCLYDSAKGRFKQLINVQQNNKDAVDISEIITMLEDSRGRLWVGSLNGLTYVDNSNGYFRSHTKPAPFTLPTSDVHYLFEDVQKNLWIGTSAGLFKMPDTATQPIPFIEKGKTKATLPFVNCIFQDTKNRIWIGTATNGIGLCDLKTNHINYFTENEGLANNNVLGILEAPDGDLWISTNNGLSRFNVAKKTFKTYTSGDGLAGNQFNYNAFLKDNEGRFYFGGYNGISAFYPNKIESNDQTAPLVFTGFKLFDKQITVDNGDSLLTENISLTKNITLHYNQNVFTLDFALLNFIKDSKNKYAYRLDGFDKQWNETILPSITYTNLQPGNYTFWAKGANNDGVWSKPISMHIQILPPYWRTWWAYCIYVLVLIGLVTLIARFFFLRALLVREDDLHQVKLNFFTNVSHEIRTHLTLIMAPVDKLLDEKKQDEATTAKLNSVKSNANRLLKLVGELMDFRKAETNHLQLHVGKYNLVEFLENIFYSFQDLALSKKINTEFKYNTKDATVYFDAEQMEKVFFNLLTNAFKFTPAGGNISLELEQMTDSTVVRVKDNGRGIAPEYLDKLFTNFFQVVDHGKQNTGYGIGLALSKHIVELHQGFITVESTPSTNNENGQTTFSVILQQGNQHFTIDKNTSVHIVGEDVLPTQTFLKPVLPAPEKQLIQGDDIATGDKPFTILITEDNPDLRQLVWETLEQTYNILLAENGLDGWQQATEQIPDLIISDVMMPEMDGLEFCNRLKTDERTSHIPVILLTAKSAQTDHVTGLETGADLYLTKPFSTKILELNVRNLLIGREKMRQRFSQQLNSLPPIHSHSSIETVTTNGAEAVETATVETAIEPVYLNPVDQEFLDKLVQIIEEFIDDPDFGVAMLSKKIAMSPPILYKKLKAVTNMSVNDFVKSLRFKKAALLLREKEFTDYDVAAAVGYYDRKYFNKEFKRLFGVSPKEYVDKKE